MLFSNDNGDFELVLTLGVTDGAMKASPLGESESGERNNNLKLLIWV